MDRIQSKNHNIGLYRINKISLSFYDDQKYFLKNGCSRLLHFQNFTNIKNHIKNNFR